MTVFSLMHLVTGALGKQPEQDVMSLKDQGFAFCISPDKQQWRWIHPAERQRFYGDWTDVTEWPDDKLVAFLTPTPEQQDLFAA